MGEIFLGIETSCDETACSVVRNGREILSNFIYSQAPIHDEFHGIIPEISSRYHLEKINMVVEKVILDAHDKLFHSHKTFQEICLDPFLHGVAVTVGPGLIGSLLIGKMTAEALGMVMNIPTIGINHLEGHLFSACLNTDLKPPFLGLIISGGHTDLVLVKDYGEYVVLGRTLDDAVGEVLDKIASLLGLHYPGGPQIEKYAMNGHSNIPFPLPYFNDTFNFSFSGLKTSVVYYVKKKIKQNPSIAHSQQWISDICASVQSVIVKVLIHKALLATKQLSQNQIVICGGVSANTYFKHHFISKCQALGIRVYYPSEHIFSTDNAAMIACVGFYKSQKLSKIDSLQINPSLLIKNWT